MVNEKFNSVTAIMEATGADGKFNSTMSIMDTVGTEIKDT